MVMDILTVCFKNYDLIKIQAEHWKNNIKGNNRLLVADATPDPDRSQYIENMWHITRGGDHFEKHGSGIDFLLSKSTTDIVGIVDSDFFWTYPDIIEYVQEYFDEGCRCVGCPAIRPIKEFHKNRQWMKLYNYPVPIVHGMFIERNLGLTETFVATGVEVRKHKRETGWRIRHRIRNNNIKVHVFDGFAIEKPPYITYFGPKDAPLGFHLLAGSDRNQNKTHLVPGLIKEGLDKWKEKIMSDVTKQGYHLAKGVFTVDEIDQIEARVKKIHNITDKNFPKSYTCPDAVNRHPELLKFVFNEKLLEAVRGQIGNNIKFLQHCDAHANTGAFPFHRDSTHRGFDCKGPEWDTSEPFLITRCAIYTRPYGFRLIPRSHVVPGKDENKAIVVNTEPGDVVIFDPRLLHAASGFNTPKYSIFLCYGVPNRHYNNYVNYYLHKRKDLGYMPLCDEVKREVAAHNL